MTSSSDQALLEVIKYSRTPLMSDIDTEATMDGTFITSGSVAKYLDVNHEEITTPLLSGSLFSGLQASVPSTSAVPRYK